MGETTYVNVIDDRIIDNLIKVIHTENRLKTVPVNVDFDFTQRKNAVYFILLPELDEHFQYTTDGEHRLYTFTLRIYLRTGERRGKLYFERITDWTELVKRLLKDNCDYEDSINMWHDLKVNAIDYNPDRSEEENEQTNLQIAEMTISLFNLEKDA